MKPSDQAAAVVFACGQWMRGDDAVAFAVVAALDASARNSATIVEAGGGLDVGRLVDLPPDARCIVVDAVAGVAPGALVHIDLARLAAAELDPAAAQLRCSSHALPLPHTLALARLLRGRAVEGTLLGIGIAQCGAGAALSRPVAGAVPAAAGALTALIARHAAAETPAC